VDDDLLYRMPVPSTVLGAGQFSQALLGHSCQAPKVIECATINPARTFRFPNHPGTLRVGTDADVAVFQILEGDFEMLASSREGPLEKRIVHRKLLPVATVKAGHLYGTASIPVVHV
jgi:predicted amidohydrolase